MSENHDDVLLDFPAHGNEDPDDNEFVERNSNPEDFLDPVEED
jgi:hypothetical protein